MSKYMFLFVLLFLIKGEVWHADLSFAQSKNNPSKTKKEAIEDQRNVYLSYNKKQREIKHIFKKAPIERKLKLKIAVSESIFDPLFDDLEFAVQKSVQYAKTKYSIKYLKKYHAYQAYDGYNTYVTIYPLYESQKQNHFVYYIKGKYTSVVTLRGHMILDIAYKQEPHGETFFDIKAFMHINNPFLRRTTKSMMRSTNFQNYMDNIIDKTIARVQRVGYKVGYGIHSETHKK